MPANNDQIHQFLLMGWNWATIFLPRLAAAIAILAIGLVIAGWISRVIARVLARAPHIDPALKPIIASVVRYSLLGLTVVVTLEQLGFRATSLLAILGAAGLAIGLALQGTLSNIAAGIMLLWLRPFQVLDYIEVAGQSGAVKEIGLFGCRLRTFDGLFLFMPNSAIWNAPLKNHTRNGGRLISIDVALPLATDIARAKSALLDVANRSKEVLRDPKPEAFLASFSASATPSGAILCLVLWSSPQGAGEVERAIVEKIKAALEALGDAFKPARIARSYPADTDPSRFLQKHDPVPY